MTPHKKLVIFEGNIGSGKSTILEEIKKLNLPGVLCVTEPVKTWEKIVDESSGKNILQHFYENKTKYALLMQLTALVSRHESLMNALKSDAQIICMERCLATDAQVFAKSLKDAGHISPIEWQIYTRWNSLFFDACPVSCYVYLTASPTVCQERVLKRARAGEEYVDLELLQVYDKYHREYLSGRERVLKLDANCSIAEHVALVLEELGIVPL